MLVTVTRTDIQDRRADKSGTYRKGRMLALPTAKPGANARQRGRERSRDREDKRQQSEQAPQVPGHPHPGTRCLGCSHGPPRAKGTSAQG